MRSLIWISAVCCSAYIAGANKLNVVFLNYNCPHTACLVSIDPDKTTRREGSRLDRYCQVLCIMLEQTQFQCFNVVFSRCMS